MQDQLLRRCTGTPSVLAGIKACEYNSGMISVVTPVSFSVICCASWSQVTLLSTPLQWERLALLSLRVQYAMETRSPTKHNPISVSRFCRALCMPLNHLPV